MVLLNKYIFTLTICNFMVLPSNSMVLIFCKAIFEKKNIIMFDYGVLIIFIIYLRNLHQLC